jgi:hypothetical protein
MVDSFHKLWGRTVVLPSPRRTHEHVRAGTCLDCSEGMDLALLGVKAAFQH